MQYLIDGKSKWVQVLQIFPQINKMLTLVISNIKNQV